MIIVRAVHIADDGEETRLMEMRITHTNTYPSGREGQTLGDYEIATVVNSNDATVTMTKHVSGFRRDRFNILYLIKEILAELSLEEIKLHGSISRTSERAKRGILPKDKSR